MLNVRVYTNDEATWRDAARRLHRAAIVAFGDAARPASAAAAGGADLFVGAAQVDEAVVARSLAAGRHALIVAEPCLTVAALERLSAAATRAGVRFAVANPDRYLPSRQLVKSQLGGPLGSPELVRIHRWESHGSAATTSPLGLPGPLVAELEQALWFVGRRPQRLFALERPSPDENGNAAEAEGGRTWQVHLSFCPGMAMIDYSDRLPDATSPTVAAPTTPSSSTASPGGDGYRSLSVIGSSGSAQTDDQANSQLSYRGGRPQAVVAGEGVRHWAALVDDFARAVEENRDWSHDSADWRAAARVVDAVLQSAARQAAVDVAGGN